MRLWKKEKKERTWWGYQSLKKSEGVLAVSRFPEIYTCGVLKNKKFWKILTDGFRYIPYLCIMIKQWIIFLGVIGSIVGLVFIYPPVLWLLFVVYLYFH